MDKLAENIEEYLKIVFEQQRQHDGDFLVCYRGESEDFDKTSCIPSLYRNQKHVENEHRLFKESIILNCDEFLNDKLTINKLTRMQHYSLPTRLLDVTTNALLGLYFACEKVEKEKDSVVTVFFIPKEKFKYYDSDTVSVISNLAKREKFDFPAGFDKKTNEIGIESEKTKYLDKFNQKKEILYLLHDIKDEKPYFKDKIVPEHLYSVVCVQPLLNNNRIRNQQGLMLVFGIDQTNKYKPAKHGFKTEKIHINGKFKSKIKNQLEMLGVTQAFVYPDIEKVSIHLKEKYKQ